VTKYDLFRRRIAPIAFGIAIAVMARQSCQKQEQAHATIVLDFGSAAAEVTAVDAELWMNGAEVAQFQRATVAGRAIGTPRFDAVLPAADGELHIDVDVHGTHRHVVRAVHAAEGATVTVPLESELK